MNRWKDWYEQGKRDMERAKIDFQHDYHEWACFTCQQAVEKIVKALGMRRDCTLWGHSLTEMLTILGTSLAIPDDLRSKAQLLDMYYIPTRYPNGFASGKPADYFNASRSKEAIDAAADIIRFCEMHLFGQK